MTHKHTHKFDKRKGERKALTVKGVIFLLIALSLFLFPITSAEEYGYNYLEPGKNLNPSTNYSKIEVNSSNFTQKWETNIGNLNNVNSTQMKNTGGTLSIIQGWVDSLWCQLTGCTMQGDIDMDDNNIFFSNTGSGIQRVINATSTNPSGVIGYELNNDVRASIALSIAGSGITDFANDSGIISRGGRTFIVNAANKSIVMGHGELPNVDFTWTLNTDGTVTQTGDLIMNNSAIFLDGNQQHFIKENVLGFPFNGISTEAAWFGHDEFEEEGEITFLFTHGNDTNLWMQSGKNNSFSSIGNSFFIVPTYMANNNFTENGVINMTKASSYLVLCDEFEIDCNFNADTLGNAIDLIPGGPLLGTMGDLEVWQSAKIHQGLSVEGPIFFDLEGNNANFNNGTVHIATGVTFEEGFIEGESVTKFTETFASGLGIFTNIQSDLGNWVNVLNSVVCDEGECAEGDGAGSGLVEMQTNFSTSDINETALSFVYSLVNLVGAGDFSIEVNNNVGSGDVEIFSDTTTSVIKSSQFIALPSSMDDQPLVTLTVICNIGSSGKPARQCFFDTAKINGTAISTTLINVSGFNSIIAFSDGTLDAGGFPQRGIFYNASEDQIVFRGNVTFENIIEQDLNITNSIFLNGTTIFDWADVVNSPFFPSYLLANGSTPLTGLWNYGGFGINGSGNINTTGTIQTTEELFTPIVTSPEGDLLIEATQFGFEATFKEGKIDIFAGDAITTDVEAGRINIFAGDALAGSGFLEGTGGRVDIDSGDGGATSGSDAVNFGSNGGPVTINSGNGGSSTATGSSINIAGNAGLSTFTGGNGGNSLGTSIGTNSGGGGGGFTIQGGAGGRASDGATNTGGGGGTLSLKGGGGGNGVDGAGAGGSITMTAGNAGSTDANGGVIAFQSGVGSGTGITGNIGFRIGTTLVGNFLSDASGLQFNDNIRTIFGTGERHSIYSDGTDFIFNPEVLSPTSIMKVLGDLNVTGNVTGTNFKINGAMIYKNDVNMTNPSTAEVRWTGPSTGGHVTPFGIDFDDSTFRPTIFGGTTRDAIERIGFRGIFAAADEQQITYGNGLDVTTSWRDKANDFFSFTLRSSSSGTSSGTFVFNSATTHPNFDTDAITNELNPTFRIQATTTGIDDYIKFNHDGSNAKIFAGTGDLIINVTDGNALQVVNNSGWADVWAKTFVQKSQVFDTSLGNANLLLKNADEYKTKGVLDKSLHYAFTTGEETDYSRPQYNLKCFISDATDETYGQEVCNNMTTYPYKKVSEGLDIGKQIATTEQAIWENNQNITELRDENKMLKDALCTLDNSFQWCLGVEL